MQTDIHFLSYLAHFFLQRETFQKEKVLEKIKTHFVFCVQFQNRAVCEIMWKNIVEPGSPQMTIWRMRTACWTPKASDTHSEYVILIAFPLQQRLHVGVPLLRYTYIACLVCCSYHVDGNPFSACHFRTFIPDVSVILLVHFVSFCGPFVILSCLNCIYDPPFCLSFSQIVGPGHGCCFLFFS
jgi:hypothetical protein